MKQNQKNYNTIKRIKAKMQPMSHVTITYHANN